MSIRSQGHLRESGANLLKHFQFATDVVNAEQLAGPGIKFEMVAFDNKASPQETLTVLKQVIDQGIRYVVQGQGSGAALALIDAIEKHNERNPNQSILFLNYAAVDPDLTNSKCSFWHFRFDANTDMKMEALTAYIKDRPEVKNVFLINQNYSHGHQVSRVAKDLLARKRPDMKVVGDDLHPLGQVRDFAPYIAKMRAANADTVITGNWGPDLALLVRAAREAGLNANFYTYYGGVIGTPTAVGPAGEDRMRMVSYWHPNITPNYPGEKMYLDFKKRFGEEFYAVATYHALTMLADTIKRTKSTDPLRVAYAMEGAKRARRQWRHRNAGGGSSTAAAAVGCLVDEGGRPQQARHRKDRLYLEDGSCISDVCRIAANQLQHEAAGVAVESIRT